MTDTASLARLQKEHAELENALKREETRPNPDDLAISRMKKEKLRLKDAMADLGDAA